MVRKRFKQFGFSLVEAMIGMGLMTAVGVGVMKLQSSQVKNEKNIDADYEVRILTSAIYDQLKNREACNQTFDDANFNSAFNFNVIRNAAGAALFQSNSQYKGKDVIQIVNFRAEPGSLQASAEDSSILEGSVRIAVSYQKSNNVLNNNNTYKKYLSLPLRVKTETSGKFLTCISASDEAIKTSLERFCKSLNGTYDGSTSPGTCDLDSNVPSNINLSNIQYSQTNEGLSVNSFGAGMWNNIFSERYVKKSGDTMTGNLVGQADIILPNATNPTNAREAVTKKYFESRVACPNPNQVGVLTATGIVCSDLICDDSKGNSQEYLVGIQSNGLKACRPLVSAGESCEEGGHLVVKADKSVGFECCKAECSASTASNTCENSKFASSNGCGFCQGKKKATEAEWSEWKTVKTEEISACTDGFIQTKITQTRECLGEATCGGANKCTGGNERTIPGPQKPCTIQSTGWACQPAETKQESVGSQWGYATNIRMDGYSWKQERPSWPVTVPNGNHWQQGNHAGCIESCRAYAKKQFAGDITSSGGEDSMLDSKKTLTVGIIDVFFQENSSYNQGPPKNDNDNSGFWCGCMMKVHDKNETLTYGSGSQYPIYKSDVDSKIEQATVCTLNGEGGTPIGAPVAPSCTPSKTCAQLKAETCSDEKVRRYDECGNSCGYVNGTKNCAPTGGGCGGRLGQMGGDYACCPDGYNAQGYGYKVEELGALDLWYLPTNPPGAFQCMRMYLAP